MKVSSASELGHEAKAYAEECNSDNKGSSDSDSDSEDGDWLARLGGSHADDSSAGAEKDASISKGGDVADLFSESEAQRNRRLVALAKRDRSTENRKLLRRIPEAGLALSQEGNKRIIVEEVVGEQNRMLWDCAGVLANFLVQRPDLVRDRRVVELGCALGLPGITSAALGAKYVILSERPSALPWIRHQIELNAETLPDGSQIEAASIEWDRDLPSHILSEGAFDVILCSDLIYAGDTETTEALARTIAALTQQMPEALVVSCFEVRNVPASENEQRALLGVGSSDAAAATSSSSHAQEQLFSRSLATLAGFCDEKVVPNDLLAEGFRDDEIIVKLHRRPCAPSR